MYHWKLLKRFYLISAHPKPPVWTISSKSLKDDAEVLALPLCNLVSLTIKQSLFPDEYNITKVPI